MSSILQKVQIVDFPDGLPGDIGMTLSWG